MPTRAGRSISFARATQAPGGADYRVWKHNDEDHYLVDTSEPEKHMWVRENRLLPRLYEGPMGSEIKRVGLMLGWARGVS